MKSWDAADEGLRLLRSDVDGRATFLVHPSDSQARFSFSVDEGAQAAPPPAPIVPLKNCIRVLNGFGKSLEVILPKLRDGYIVPDPEFATGFAAGHGLPVDLATLSEETSFHRALGDVVARVNGGLAPAERVRRFTIALEPFSLANAQLTPTLKIRRHAIRDAYQGVFDRLYEGAGMAA